MNVLHLLLSSRHPPVLPEVVGKVLVAVLLNATLPLAAADNPFIQTPWEHKQDLSLVVNFYYPKSVQARGPLAPWEASQALRFIGDPSAGGRLPSADRIRFYRLAQPPGDVNRHHDP